MPQGFTLKSSVTTIALPHSVSSTPALEGKGFDWSLLSLWGRALGARSFQKSLRWIGYLWVTWPLLIQLIDGGDRGKSRPLGQNPDYLCLRNQPGAPSSAGNHGQECIRRVWGLLIGLLYTCDQFWFSLLKKTDWRYLSSPCMPRICNCFPATPPIKFSLIQARSTRYSFQRQSKTV